MISLFCSLFQNLFIEIRNPLYVSIYKVMHIIFKRCILMFDLRLCFDVILFHRSKHGGQDVSHILVFIFKTGFSISVCKLCNVITLSD